VILFSSSSWKITINSPRAINETMEDHKEEEEEEEEEAHLG